MTRHFPYCSGSGQFIGYAEIMNYHEAKSAASAKMVPNPAYVTDKTAKCDKCKRIISVVKGKLKRHKVHKLQ